MRLLLCHNFYQQPGGEDVVFRSEAQLLRDKGHEVFLWTLDNKEITQRSSFRVALSAIWSRRAAEELERQILIHKPDLAHFHNTFPLMSPAVYPVCARHGVPVVQTLHNYRLMCPSALLYRNGAVCQRCVGRAFPFPGVRYACYRNSRLETMVSGMVTAVHWRLKTYQTKVGAYIALTRFAKDLFCAAGLPAERIHVKPNFVLPDPGQREGAGAGFLYAGRLQPEKGVATLLRAWQGLDYSLVMLGDGELRSQVVGVSERSRTIRYEGAVPREKLFAIMKQSMALVFPSEWFEGFPLLIAEAMACGVPVIASRLGAAGALIVDGVTGLLFNLGDAADLAAKVRWLASHPEDAVRMGQQARQEYEAKYTPEQNYRLLMNIYAQAGACP